jgi:hypothetical protein
VESSAAGTRDSGDPIRLTLRMRPNEEVENNDASLEA